VTAPMEMDSKAMATKNKLSKLQGAQFDHAYMQAMLSDHQHDVSEFRKEAQSGTDPEIKSFASKTLPTLEDHLKQAKTTMDSLKSGSNK